MAFADSVGDNSVRLCSAVGEGTVSVGTFVVVVASVVGVVVGRGVAALGEGVGELDIVARVGDVVGREVCIAAFETAVGVISAAMPATVGTVVCAVASEEEALTLGDAPHVAAGVAAWAAQRQRTRTAKRKRADFMNGLTVHLPWGRGRAAESRPSRLS
ncbi:MAG: hypothetical protein ABFC89_04985 [Methanospirillum sp.]